MRKTTSKRLTCLVLSLLMFASTLPAAVLAAEEVTEDEAPRKTTLQEISESLNSYSYANYREEHADASRGTGTVEIQAVDYLAEETTAEVSVVSDYQGKSGKSLMIDDDGKVTWEVNIPAAGLYAIKVDYCSVTEKTNSIERSLYINGVLPFAEVRDLVMKKIWVNAYTDGRFEVDSNGNELRPVSTVQHTWQEYTFIDPNSYFADPFEFFFEKGTNTISLVAVREDVVIQTITLFPYEDLPAYAEYVSGKSEAAASEKIHIVAETPSRTSDFTVYPIYDRKSAISEPQDASKIKLNTIGSEKWQTAGQWVEYDFDVEAAGLYEIVFRYRQNELSGMYTSRKVYIDGEIPFEESNYLKFNYNSNWQVEAGNNGAETFQY